MFAICRGVPVTDGDRVRPRGGGSHVGEPSGKHRWRTAAVVIAGGGVLLTACGGSSATTPAGARQAQGYSYEELAAGRVDALPSGPQFLRVNQFIQPAGTSFPSKTHQPGILYMVEGVQRYQPIPGTPTDIHAGEAHFQRTEAHIHTNIGTTDNLWYQFALWPSDVRTQPLSVPTKVVYETEDIPTSQLTAPDIETLRLVTLEANGHTPLFSHGGLEGVFVLSGTLKVAIQGQTPVTVGAMQGAFVPKATEVQESNAGAGAVRYLAFFVTPMGQPFETESGS
jgi:quercetin dioxygenase-like cupin family protein